MSKFQAGDLCEIVDHPFWRQKDKQGYIGKHIVLLEACNCLFHSDYWAPYWRVSGLGCNRHVSQLILRKVPPPALDKEETEELEDVTG